MMSNTINFYWMLIYTSKTKQKVHACSVNSIGASSELRLLLPPSLLWSEATKEVRFDLLPTFIALFGEMLLTLSDLINTDGTLMLAVDVRVVTGVA